MTIEYLTQITSMVSSLGEDATSAFIWFLVTSVLRQLLIIVVVAFAVILVYRVIVRIVEAVCEVNKNEQTLMEIRDIVLPGDFGPVSVSERITMLENINRMFRKKPGYEK